MFCTEVVPRETQRRASRATAIFPLQAATARVYCGARVSSPGEEKVVSKAPTTSVEVRVSGLFLSKMVSRTATRVTRTRSMIGAVKVPTSLRPSATREEISWAGG